MGTSYIPFPPWAVFFCYVPLWVFALKQEKIKPLLIGAWLCQFIATLIGFNWVAYTIREFGFFPWPLAIIGLLIFASFANLHIPIALFFWFMSRKRFLPFCSDNSKKDFPAEKEKDCGELSNSKSVQLKQTKKNLFPFLFTFLTLPLYSALVMKYYPMIFDWHFGYTWFYMRWPASQTAEIWGFQFLNTLTLFSNLPFLYFFLHVRQILKKKSRNFKADLNGNSTSFETTHNSSENQVEDLKKNPFKYQDLVRTCKHPIWILLAWLVFFAILNLYGGYLKSRWPEPDQTASVLLVQPNVENLSSLSKKIKRDPRPVVLRKLIKETHAGIDPQRKIDFILWPEGAYPYHIKHNKKSVKNNPAQRKARKWQIPIVLSAIGQQEKRLTNSIFVFNQKGKLVQAPYDKTLLLAFGEYMPGEKWLPINKFFSYYDRSFMRGTGENKVVLLNGINLGFQICYEGLFDFFTRDLALKKAQMIINVTNDSWYGSWQEPYQHLYMTLGRAIEVRRPLIRATNTGLSTLISAKGDIGPVSTINKSSSRIYLVPYYSRETQTVFTSWGYYIDQYFLWILCLCLLSFYILINKSPLKKENKKNT